MVIHQRPTLWGQIQFEEEKNVAVCKNVEHPGRYVVDQLFLSQTEYQKSNISNGTFSADIATLATPAYCAAPACDLAALTTAMAETSVFALAMTVTKNVTKITRECTKQPCFTAEVTVTPPAGSHAAGHKYTVKTNENRYVRVAHTAANDPSPEGVSGTAGNTICL